MYMKGRLHIFVHGLVQGVFFRANTVSIAQQLGLGGWVRNCEDGESVEILAEGEKKQLEKLLEWVKKGPEGALVEKAESKWLEFGNEFKDFKVK